MPYTGPLPGVRLPKNRVSSADDERQQRRRARRTAAAGSPPGATCLGLGEGYHLRRFTSSTLIVSRLRKIRITIARPIPTSAAATAITNSAKIWPVTSCSYAENADEVHVHRVQHQLDRHQHEHGVAAGQHAVDAGARTAAAAKSSTSGSRIIAASSFRASTTRRSAPPAAGTRWPRTAARSCENIDVPDRSAVVGVGEPSTVGSLQRERVAGSGTRGPARTPSATTRATSRCWLSSVSRPIGAFVSIRPNRNRITIAPDVDQDLHPGRRTPPRAAGTRPPTDSSVTTR